MTPRRLRLYDAPQEAEMSESYKLCERCGSDFQRWVEACLDCGGPLVEVDPRMTTPPRVDRPSRRGRGGPSAEREEPALALTAADQPTLLRSATLDYLGPLQASLGAAGVRCDVIPEDDCGKVSCQSRCFLYVAAADLDRATAIDRQHFAAAVPDADSLVDLDGESCPACGTPKSAGTVECAECGLALGFGPEDLDDLAADEDEEIAEKLAL